MVAGRTAAGVTHPLLRKLDMNGAVQWSKAFAVGSLAETHFTHVIATADGGVLVGGYTYASTALGRSVMLMKVDPLGNVVWTKNYGVIGGGSLQTQFGGLVQMSDGGFAFCGGGGVFVIRLDAQADLLWSRSFQAGGFGFQGRGLAEMPDGGLVLCARSNTIQNTVLIRLDPNGNTAWVKEYEFGASIFSKYNDPYQVAVAQDGNIVFAGYFTTPDTTWFGVGGGGDMLVTKVDPDGIPIWATVVGTDTTTEIVYALVPTPDGGVALGAHTITAGFESYRPCAAKLDADGQLLWSQVFGTVEYGLIYRGGLATDGDILFLGQHSPDPNNTFPPPATRLWKMDQAGASCPNCLAAPWAVAEYTDSIEYYIPSYTEGTGWAAQDSCTFIITDNTASTTYDVCGTSAVEEVQSEPLIHAFPNPFSTSTTISLAPELVSRDPQLVVFDALGRLVRSETITVPNFILRRDALGEGLYPYRVLLNGEPIGTGKLMVAGDR